MSFTNSQIEVAMRKCVQSSSVDASVEHLTRTKWCIPPDGDGLLLSANGEPRCCRMFAFAFPEEIVVYVGRQPRNGHGLRVHAEDQLGLFREICSSIVEGSVAEKWAIWAHVVEIPLGTHLLEMDRGVYVGGTLKRRTFAPYPAQA